MVHTLFIASLGASEMIGLLRDTTLLGKTVLLILFLLSVMSWAVMIDKARTLSLIRKGHIQFWKRCDAWLDQGGEPDDLDSWCRDREDLPLANLWVEGRSKKTPQSIRRASERVSFTEVESLERYLIILSTTVTISPFLGLMGTVWGIMQAFWDMSAMRSANLTVVAPGIAEALITTIAGLSAAIPAVVFFNLFVRKIDLIGNEMDRLRSLLEEHAPRSSRNQGRDHPPRRPDTYDKERIR